MSGASVHKALRSQGKVNVAMVEALRSLSSSDEAQTDMMGDVLEKLVELTDLVDQLSERQVMSIELLTKHIDSEHE